MRAIRTLGFNVLVWGLVLAVAFPLFWMVVTSLKPQFELFRRPPTMLPETVTFEHYTRLLTETPFLTYFTNSVILATSTTLVVIAIATLGRLQPGAFFATAAARPWRSWCCSPTCCRRWC